MPPIIGDQGDQWKQAQTDLSAFAGNKIVVIMRGSTGGGYTADLAIDDINILVAPLLTFRLPKHNYAMAKQRFSIIIAFWRIPTNGQLLPPLIPL
ncbi:MAG: hypothetical protein R3B93_20015 [Bacteroidia bacterium]